MSLRPMSEMRVYRTFCALVLLALVCTYVVVDLAQKPVQSQSHDAQVLQSSATLEGSASRSNPSARIQEKKMMPKRLGVVISNRSSGKNAMVGQPLRNSRGLDSELPDRIPVQLSRAPGPAIGRPSVSSGHSVSAAAPVKLRSKPESPSQRPSCYVHTRRYVKPSLKSALAKSVRDKVNVCEKGIPHNQRRLSAGKPENEAHGGWELSRNSCYHLDLKFAEAVAGIVNGGSLTELGAGKGCYTQILRLNGVQIVVAVDGAPNVESLTAGLVLHWDLTRPLEALADWVMSVEVAEHIPKEFEAAFVDNVVRNARCNVLLSWSRINDTKGGSGHVNPREKAYVRQRMEENGFAEADYITAWLSRRTAWLAFNVRVFYRNATCREPRVPATMERKSR